MISSARRLFVMFCVVLMLVVGCSKGAGDSTEHSFAIYLVKGLTTTEAMDKVLAELPLEDAPLLTDKDIRTYNWRKHSFSLKDGFSLEEKLEGRVPMSGKPFVVVVDGERAYMGSFWTLVSSLYIPEIPTINSIWFKDSENDTYTIRYGMDHQDPRENTKVYEVLKSLGKIEKE